MKRWIAALAIIIIGTVNSMTVLASVGVSARSAILIEKDSGRVLFEKNSEEKLPMASTTKIMTAAVALESRELDREIEISESAAGVEGSSMYLQKGEVMTLRDLLYGLMLSSGNDAAVAIAEDCRLRGEVRRAYERKGGPNRNEEFALHEPERTPRRESLFNGRGYGAAMRLCNEESDLL